MKIRMQYELQRVRVSGGARGTIPRATAIGTRYFSSFDALLSATHLAGLWQLRPTIPE